MEGRGAEAARARLFNVTVASRVCAAEAPTSRALRLRLPPWLRGVAWLPPAWLPPAGFERGRMAPVPPEGISRANGLGMLNSEFPFTSLRES